MYKKEVIFASLVFIVVFISGCSEDSVETSFVSNYEEWSNSFPDYYSEIDTEYSSVINLAVRTENADGCNEILIDYIKENGNPSIETVRATSSCRYLVVKALAFKEKSLTVCRDLYFDDNIAIYEECRGPIVADLAILNKDISLCRKQLTNENLIKLCEEDYETFA